MTLVRSNSMFAQPQNSRDFNLSHPLWFFPVTFTPIIAHPTSIKTESKSRQNQYHGTTNIRTKSSSIQRYYRDQITMELSREPLHLSVEYGSPLDACMTAEEREHVAREGWAYFDRIYGNDDDEEGNPLAQEAKYQRLDRYPSPLYRYDSWYTDEYEFRRRAQNQPLSPPATPPHNPQQHTRRKTASRVQKSQKSKPSPSLQKELRRQKKKAPRRPLTRSLDEGAFQEIELDSRPGKVKYWNVHEGPPQGWSYYSLTYDEYVDRWV